MPRRELVKLLVQAVALERDDEGQVTGEAISEARACYTLEELVAFHAQAQVDVTDWNAAQPNRQQRRQQRRKGAG